MATKLGKVGMTLGGEYDPTREYDKLTCVYHNGVSWVSRGIVPANNTPADGSNYWQKISARGE